MSQDLSPQMPPEPDSTLVDPASLGEDATPQIVTEVVLDCYECSSCGYTYDPKKGDSRGKVPEGTAFPDLIFPASHFELPDRAFDYFVQFL